MSITCKICNLTFPKIIPWQHLRTHGISGADYRAAHGTVYSEETLKKFTDRVPHNKGIKLTDPVQLAKLHQRIQRREARYQSGEFSRGQAKTEEQRAVLRAQQLAYTAANPEAMRARTKKAVATKTAAGYDFGSPMRGKSQTTVSKQKSSETIRSTNLKKSTATNFEIIAKIHQLGLTLINSVTDANFQLQCNKCSTEFSFTKQYFQPSKFKTSMCPTCFPRTYTVSKPETELFEFVQSLEPTAIQSYRPRYHSKEIDIFIPRLKLGLEFNGLYWHSEQVLLANNQPKTKDFIKQQQAQTHGIRLIQIFEDEWATAQDIVKSRITNLLAKTQTVVYARKCVIQLVTSRQAAEFCNQNHIMGSGRSNERLGLYFDNQLISVMTFSKSNLSRKIVGWELNRFCSKINIQVVGGASRLFKKFIQLHAPTQVVSYSDNRWSVGGIYSTLGFAKTSSGTPNYWYIPQNTTSRIHRFNLRKNKLDDPLLSESQNRYLQGYNKIWDSGSSKWEWNSK